MPELPDIEVYLAALRSRIQGQPLEAVRLNSPFLLRTVEPPISSFPGRRVEELRRLGKRMAIGFESGLFAVIHLMITGRLHWKARGAKVSGKAGLAAFDFPTGTLTLTESGSKKRAALYLVEGEEALAALNPGGLEVLEADLDAFRTVLMGENHTLKRALTDPHLLSGIGNAYSDEILHAARLSPFRMSQSLSADESRRLYEATCATLRQWIDRLREQAAGGSRQRSPHSTTRWPSTDAMESRARAAARQCNGSPTRRTKPTTAPRARQQDACSRTGPSRDC